VTAGLVFACIVLVFAVGQLTTARVVHGFAATSDELMAETKHNVRLFGVLAEVRRDVDLLVLHADDSDAARLVDSLDRLRDELTDPDDGVEIEADSDEAEGQQLALRHVDNLTRQVQNLRLDGQLSDEDWHRARLQDTLWQLATDVNEISIANTHEVGEELDQARALREWAGLVAVAGLVGGLAVLAASAWGLARTALHPLEQFRRQVEGFADGDRVSRAQVTGVEEIRSVAVAFNAMADRLAASEIALTRQAFTDELTGLPNRAAFLTRLADLAAPSADNSAATAGCVLFLDLDRFKTVNDSLGHAYGDELLVAVSRRLTGALRSPADIAARLGGDEFAVLLPGAELPAAERVAQRLHTALADPLLVRGTSLTASASVGITRITAGSDVGGLLRNADVAMYVAKAEGRNQHRVFTADMHTTALARLDTEQDLRAALDRDELVLHYQPVVALTPGGQPSVRSVEALIRWQHPQRGLLTPAAFLDVAVEAGLIEQIGTHVLRRACLELAEMRRVAPELTVAVNLTARELHSPQLLGHVRDALASAGLPPTALVVELTESETVADPTRAAARLTELRTLGVRVAIDDFGTGYSSLAYLRELPIDVLKIDRSFLQHITTNTRDRHLVDAVVAMSTALGFDTVAEGIEDPHQQELLARMGCSHGQGYGICRPQPPAELLTWLAGNTFAAHSISRYALSS
jgi:diguanylate cyclase (GGDEF)-like protein